MKKVVLSLLAGFLLTAPMFGQSSLAGLMIGKSESTDQELQFELNDTSREIFFATSLEPDTIFKLKAGRVDAANENDLDPGATNGRIEYVDALVEYEFDQVFGSTALFAGPGYYRQRFGDYEEADYGLSGGINGVFPITRRFALIAEAAYHWAHFDEARSFVTVSGGFQLAF